MCVCGEGGGTRWLAEVWGDICKEGAERLLGGGGDAMLRVGESASFQTPIFCHRGCGGGTVPCCTSLIKTTTTHTTVHAHTHTPPALLSPPALIESSLCAIRYLLFPPAESNLLIFPECLSLPPPPSPRTLPLVHPSYRIANKLSGSVCPD